MTMMPACKEDSVSLVVGWKGFGDVYLDDEDENGVLGIIGGGIGSLEDASLTRCSDGHGDSSGPCECVLIRVNVCQCVSVWALT